MTIWINEFHYDNAGGDIGEFLEIAGLAGTDLTGWSIYLYNGSNGTTYGSIDLTGYSISDQDSGYGTLSFSFLGIQNGSPDGIALIDDTGALVQFLSYEGSFTATTGPIAGETSTDIGVFEPSDTPEGFSLQLTGSGTAYSDFTWAAAGPNTSGAVNTGQSFGGGSGPGPNVQEIGTETEAMLDGQGGWTAEALFTVGEQTTSGNAYNDLNGDTYAPGGVLDGVGAYALDDNTVRVFVNHEFLNFRGSEYLVSDGAGGSFAMTGARISYFDVDKATMQVVDSGLAYNTIYDATGAVATDTGFLSNDFSGFSRFCSAVLVEAEQFGEGRGLADRIFFAGEEDGGFFNGVGGAEWALDPETGALWQLPAFGRGAWENVAEIDSGSDDQVAFILADDSSPFDFDGDGETEAAPLFLYVGTKIDGGDFLERNGLKDGQLYVWVSDAGDLTPLDYNGTGATRGGTWVAVDNSPVTDPALMSEDGSTGYDEYGYPTQGNLWLQARDLGAFGFSRPEDVAVNPVDGTEFALASTGVDTYAVDPVSGDGADSFGTVYTMSVDVQALTGEIRIAYDGDDDPARALRSPDNLDWADDGFLYIQEDKAETDTLTGEPLFGDGAANTNEASIVRLNPETGAVETIAIIDRSVVLDPSTTGTATDGDAGEAGAWESSGILDVSTLFGMVPGTLFIATVQAHGVEDQDEGSAITDDNLVEGGQLLFLRAPAADVPPAPEAAEDLIARHLGTIALDGAEIVAFDPETMKAFVTSGDGLSVVDASDPSDLKLVDFLMPRDKANRFDDGINSVAVYGDLVAVAQAGSSSRDDGADTEFGRTQHGRIVFFDAETGKQLGWTLVGPNPDDLKFNADGTHLIVVNEGESSGEENEPDAAVNPKGSISIIAINDMKPGSSPVKTLNFNDPSITFDALEALGLRVNRDAPSAAADLEPEYVTLDGNTAYITLQENNGLLVIEDITNPGRITIDNFVALGTKDHSVAGAGLDASNRDGAINIQTYNIDGLYMPDQLATVEVDGKTYILTANEGDGRDVDESRGHDLVDGDLSNGEIDWTEMDATTIIQLGLDDQLGRLKFSNVDGDIDGDGLIEVLHSFGGRSFSIWDAETGEQVFDSGDDFEQITALAVPDLFNADDGDPGEFDERSDDKGPEPEAITVGEIDGQLYAFIALERTGGVMMYNITDPLNASFEQYITIDGDVSPEGLQFIAPGDSPTGEALLAIANEVSGTLSFVSLTSRDVAIYDIQGAGHRSAFEGETVRTGGIVTAVDSNGFYLQDPDGDGDIATSDAIFVFTGSRPTVAVGDAITLQGRVVEFGFSGELTLTELTSISNLTVLSSGNALPEAVIIGASGRVPPSQSIDDDAFADFDPENDGLDFFESLEAMRVTGEDLMAVTGTNRFGEIFAVANQGADATGLSERGTLNISPDDFNPERIQIDEDSGIFNFDFPTVDTGALLSDVTGVITYDFGNFQITPTEDFTAGIVPSELASETSALVGGDGVLTVATYNVLNLDPVVEDPAKLLPGVSGGVDDDLGDGRFDAIAAHIVSAMNNPLVIGLQEVQDNTGAEGIDDVISASDTLDTLVAKIVDAGGPAYSWIDNTFITDDASGGIPGGNIRTAFLYNDDVLDLIDGSVQTIGGQGAGDAFDGGRLPLVADFLFGDEVVTIINLHLSSKGGSAPIMGLEQDFAARQEDVTVNGSLDERQVQAQAVADFVSGKLAADADANVIVLGDMNEFEFVSPLQILEGAGLTNLWDGLPEDEIYSYSFQGNSQALDHILVSDALLSGAGFDAVHVNSEFAETSGRASDHDPLLASLMVEDTFILA